MYLMGATNPRYLGCQQNSLYSDAAEDNSPYVMNGWNAYTPVTILNISESVKDNIFSDKQKFSESVKDNICSDKQKLALI